MITSPTPIKQTDRMLWLVVRRALIMVIRAFDERFDVKENQEKRIA